MIPSRPIPSRTVTSRTVTDQDARDAIAGDLTSTIFVEAGAGSGKTTQLVARILQLLLSRRATVDQLAAITFTEAAAAELRDRVAGQLERAAADDPDGGRRAAATEALAGLDGAALTTLHGFSRRILAEYPLAAGLPPGFEVLDEVRSVVAFDDRWAGTVDALLADPATARAVQWLLACGARLDDLRSLARSLDGNWDRVPTDPAESPPLPPIDPDQVLRPLRGALALAAACADPADRLARHLVGLAPLAERLDGCPDELQVLAVLAGARTKLTAGNRGQLSAWDGRKADVQALLAEAQAAKDQLLAEAAAAALGRLRQALGRATLDAAAGRRREGRLEFHDLLVLARDLVRDDGEVCAALHDRYRFLLIDEFQDTDPIQAELATRIAAARPGSASPGPASPGPASPGPASVGPASPGRLFFVGDPRQSIYRFRRADVELFLDAKARLADRSLSLVTNFRSVPPIVDWVDDVFGRLIGEGDPGLQPAYVPSRAARPPHPDGTIGATAGVPFPGVSVLGLGGPPPGRAEEARAREAADIAAAVRSIRDQGWPVGDGGRPATLADVTVLVPTRRPVPALQEAFDAAEVPYRLESSSLVYAAPEVQDLLAILHAVDDPTDEPAVLAALRCPGFGCGDDDLVRFRQAGGRWDYRLDPPPGLPAADPVTSGLLALRDLHGRRWWSEVCTLVGRVVDDRRLLPLALDGPRWREAWRRLRFVVDQARQFTESSPGDLRRFLAWVDLQAADDARVTEVVLPESDVDAVRIMTVHAAKGLEFPVVVLAGLGAEPRRLSGPGILFGPAGPELGLRKGLATDGYDDLADREDRLDALEQVRLLYVAATRAQDHLVVSVHRADRARTSLAARLVDVAEGSAWVPLSLPAAPVSVPASATGPAAGLADVLAFGEPTTSEDARLAWVEDRDRRLASRPRTLAATGVAKLADDGGGPPRSVWGRGRAGTAVGRAVHGTLQVVDLDTGAGLDDAAHLQAAAEGIPARAGEVARLVRAALSSEVVRQAVAGGRYWRELYVGAPVGGRVLEGFVDLLVDGPDGLEVVDYKTDQGPDDPADGYRLQGAAYAVAVEAALRRPVRCCTFLRLRPDGASTHRVADLEAAKAEVHRLLADA